MSQVLILSVVGTIRFFSTHSSFDLQDVEECGWYSCEMSIGKYSLFHRNTRPNQDPRGHIIHPKKTD